MVLPEILRCHQICDFPKRQLSHVVAPVQVDIAVVKVQPEEESVIVSPVEMHDKMHSSNFKEPALQSIEANDKFI